MDIVVKVGFSEIFSWSITIIPTVITFGNEIIKMILLKIAEGILCMLQVYHFPADAARLKYTVVGFLSLYTVTVNHLLAIRTWCTFLKVIPITTKEIFYILLLTFLNVFISVSRHRWMSGVGSQSLQLRSTWRTLWCNLYKYCPRLLLHLRKWIPAAEWWNNLWW